MRRKKTKLYIYIFLYIYKISENNCVKGNRLRERENYKAIITEASVQTSSNFHEACFNLCFVN